MTLAHRIAVYNGAVLVKASGSLGVTVVAALTFVIGYAARRVLSR